MPGQLHAACGYGVKSARILYFQGPISTPAGLLLRCLITCSIQADSRSVQTGELDTILWFFVEATIAAMTFLVVFYFIYITVSRLHPSDATGERGVDSKVLTLSILGSRAASRQSMQQIQLVETPNAAMRPQLQAPQIDIASLPSKEHVGCTYITLRGRVRGLKRRKMQGDKGYIAGCTSMPWRFPPMR
jgi:hypothetical protein